MGRRYPQSGWSCRDGRPPLRKSCPLWGHLSRSAAPSADCGDFDAHGARSSSVMAAAAPGTGTQRARPPLSDDRLWGSRQFPDKEPTFFVAPERRLPGSRLPRRRGVLSLDTSGDRGCSHCAGRGPLVWIDGKEGSCQRPVRGPRWWPSSELHDHAKWRPDPLETGSGTGQGVFAQPAPGKPRRPRLRVGDVRAMSSSRRHPGR